MAVGFVSVIAVPAGLVLSFLGINASQVNPQVSMFSHRHLPMYLTMVGVLVVGALLAITVYLLNRHAKRDESATKITWVMQLTRRNYRRWTSCCQMKLAFLLVSQRLISQLLEE